jgi:hemolysin D
MSSSRFAISTAVGRLRSVVSLGNVVSDRHFLPQTLEILETAPSPTRTALMLAICTILTTAIAAAWLCKIDVYAQARGKVQSIGRSKVIQPLDTGKVVAIYVANSAHVKRGDTLLVLDPTEASADLAEHARQLAEYAAEIARRSTAIAMARSRTFDSVPAIPFDVAAGIDPSLRARETGVLAADVSQLKSALASLEARGAEIRAQKEALEQTIASQGHLIDTLRERLEIRQALEKKSWEAHVNVIDAAETLARETTSLVDHRGQLLQADATLRSVARQEEETIAKFIDDNSQQRASVAAKLDDVRQEAVKSSAKTERTRLVSPIDGTVQELGVTTLGQVVTSGQQLMTIVPDAGPIEIEALISNEDIGFIAVGQEAVVKVDTFPFTIYGTLVGRVSGISRDAVDAADRAEALPTADAAATAESAETGAAARVPGTQNFVFPVTVSLGDSTIMVDGKALTLSPGMTVNVEVRTTTRRVIDYLLSPLQQIGSEAFHER